MSPKFSLLAFILLSGVMHAQNLIPDSSFENNKTIPTDFSGIGNSYTWTRPSMGTTDLFSIPDRKQKKYSMVGVPKNAMGFQYPHSGRSYAGFFLFSHDNYREYLQTPLLKTLEKGKTYCVTIYISLADHASTHIDQIGFSFLPAERHFETSDVLDTLKPVYIKLDKVKGDTIRWHAVTGRYKAAGTENYLVIGSFEIHKIKRTGFKFPKDLKTPINRTSMRDAYYFVDDVSLVECEPLPDEKKDMAMKTIVDTLSEGRPFVMETVLFESGTAVLTSEVDPFLDLLAETMGKNPELRIIISGHTDNIGDRLSNKKLSEQRAESVAKYLVKKGIDSERISTQGYGDTQPLVANDTEEHRAKNRRVEIIFIK